MYKLLPIIPVMCRICSLYYSLCAGSAVDDLMSALQKLGVLYDIASLQNGEISYMENSVSWTCRRHIQKL